MISASTKVPNNGSCAFVENYLLVAKVLKML